MCLAFLNTDHIAYFFFSKSKKEVVHLIYGGLSFVQELYFYPVSRHAFYLENDNRNILYDFQ
jgi:hypothetical protein